MTNDDFSGSIQVRPPLNEAERAYMLALLDSEGTLRGTPTGRGDTGVPFARLAWAVCFEGCCLVWNSEEDSKWMVESLRFVVDHLLRSGAKAEGHPRFAEFTFDHELSGAVMGRSPGDRSTRFVTVTDNLVAGGVTSGPCGESAARPAAEHAERPRGKRPDNVIELRPRRA